MKTFIHKEISEESEDGMIRVTRSRTNGGACLIVIAFGNKRLEISNDHEDIGDDYEQRAYELARTIEKIADNPCLIDGE